MKKQEIYLKSSKMLELVNDLTLKAKEINMIKPVKEALKDISATNEAVPLDYFGLIVSSHIEKSKEVSRFKYNEPLRANSITV